MWNAANPIKPNSTEVSDKTSLTNYPNYNSSNMYGVNLDSEFNRTTNYQPSNEFTPTQANLSQFQQQHLSGLTQSNNASIGSILFDHQNSYLSSLQVNSNTGNTNAFLN